MNQTPTAQMPSRRKILLSLLGICLLTGLIFYVFKDHWAEITAALGQLSVWQVLVVLALGATPPLMEGLVCWLIIRSRQPGFTLRQGLDTSWLGQFCTVATFGTGVVPMQTYYLYRCGLDAGPGVGLMTLEYVFHKSAVLVYATVMMLVQREWLAANSLGALQYLLPAYVMVALIILGLVMVCVSPLAQRLARWLLGFLPKSEKWQARRESWLEQLDFLSRESRHLLENKRLCVLVFCAQLFKLFMLYSLPYLCIQFMHLGDLTFWQVQLLASLMMFVSNALPNLAGMGSVETAFLLMFSGFLGQAGAMSALMLYRIGNYYFVFLCSTIGFVGAQRRLAKMEPRK